LSSPLSCRRHQSPVPENPRRQGPLHGLRVEVRNPPDTLPPSLSLPFTYTASPKFCGRRRAAPLRKPFAPAVPSHGRREHQSRRVPHVTPVPSPSLPVPYSAPTASSVGMAMAPLRLGHRPTSRSTVDPVDPRPAPRSTSATVDPPTLQRHVASQAGHPRWP